MSTFALIFTVAWLSILAFAFWIGKEFRVVAIIILGLVSLFAAPAGVVVFLLAWTIVAVGAWLVSANNRKFVAWSTVAILVPCVFVLSRYVPRYREILELRQEHPIVSLRDRLDYETQHAPLVEVQPGHSPPIEGRASDDSNGDGAAQAEKRLADMEHLEDIKTRDLDEFETDGLGQLRGGEDLVVDSGENEIRMLGSLRALRQCQECHSAKRGELLGAFTYRIVRDPPVAELAAPQSLVPAF